MVSDNNRKKLLILGGLAYSLPVIEEAHKLGAYIITVDNVPSNIAHQYSDEYCDVSILDKEAVLRVAASKNVDGVLSHATDPGVVTAAYVCEKLGLPYQCSYEASLILQSKQLFRKFLSDNGFPCPSFNSFSSIDDAIAGIGSFNLPVIVKPVDSAGSKGVTKVSSREELQPALTVAFEASFSKKVIIEDYLEAYGYQSSSDIFVVNGELVYCTFSDQLFDKNSSNPNTPAIEIWPSSMPQTNRDNLKEQLQKAISLLGITSGLFNIEARVCTNGESYLMEMSPRGGGNRIADIQSLGSGQNLIANEVMKALNIQIDGLSDPVYDGVWCNVILHSNKVGIFKSLSIDDDFYKKYVKQIHLSKKEGDTVSSFSGANASLGNIFLRFGDREELNSYLEKVYDYIKINIE